MKKSYTTLFAALSLLPFMLGSFSAQAVPSFARQTGMACSSCHTTYPELTAFGRRFKLLGYTMTNKKLGAKGLSIGQLPPISVMLQANATNTKANNPKSNSELPSELSLFLAGRISPDMGSFIQVTMEQDTGFAIDNTDIRYARQSGDNIYGITLNNSPTTQDVWNSTPNWGYPWTGGASVNAPIIASLGQSVAGLGAYTQMGNGLYAELSFYRETGGFDAPAGGVTGTARIKGLAPYWRFAWEKNLSNGDNLMVGTYGMQVKLYDNASTPVAGQDKYRDIAIDTQYEHFVADSDDLISVHATYTHEKQTLGMSAPGTSPKLKSLRLDGTYHWGHRVAATLGYNQNSGNSGAYDDNAWTGQISYLPWLNTKFTIQYTAYTKLAGVTSTASDNNTLLLQAWLMW
ncbi:MAG TPA: hypothetical protein ENI65_08135 [Gammaproteobacteria bacterium]|nr:hypothetical protein [Gammaproteobacteria bacterium]